MTLPRKQQHLADRPTREVYDAEGRSWVLGEVSRRRPDGTYEVALVAEDGDLLRRFTDFSPDWYHLPDELLVRLVDGPCCAARGADDARRLDRG